MQAYDVAKTIHRDLAGIAPKFCASANRALVDIGEGSKLVGLGEGTHENDVVTIHETESISGKTIDPYEALFRITQAIEAIRNASSWEVIVEQKIAADKKSILFRYTFIRDKKNQ